MNSPSTEVGPGLLAFVVFFFLAVALWLLMRNMFVRLRRMNLAERAEEQRVQRVAAEQDELAQRAREMDVPGRPASDGAEDSGDHGEESLEADDSAVGDGAEEGQGRRDEV